MDNVYLLVAIVGAIGFLVAGVTGIIQAIASWTTIQPQHRKWLYRAIIAFFAVSVVFGGATYITARPSNTTNPPATLSPTATLPPSTSTVVPSSPISSPTATPISQVTPTALATDGTIPENKRLTCGGCNDPIHFTIDSITIENGNERMIWNITLNNISGAGYWAYDNSSIALQVSSGANPPVHPSGYSEPFVNAGDKVTLQLIFAFVPYKEVQYTFSAHIVAEYNLTDINMPFDSVNFTF